MGGKKKDITALMLLFGMLLTSLISCSPKVASFFFDGVPPADTSSVAMRDSLHPDTSGAVMIASRASTPQMNTHAPYQLKKCNTCHSPYSASKLAQPEPGVCYQCHDDYSLTYKVVHGPVAAGYCTNCHHPHASANSKLLRRTGQQLCLQCHESGTITGKPHHASIGEASCTDCHDPHGADNRNLIKQEGSR